MPKTRRIGNVYYTSFFDEVNKQLNKGEKRNRLKAVRYLARKLRLEIKKEYGKNDLYEGIDYDHGETISRFGYTKPAYHAHLIEFGTDERFVKNWRKTGKGKSVGRMPKKPIFIPFIQKEADNVGSILAEPWVK